MPFSLSTSGPSSSQTPYLVNSEPNVRFVSIVTVGDNFGKSFVGIPDGIGAFDNGDGTLTVLVNHELGATAGVARAHGGKGAFVSKVIVDKADLSVDSISDLITTVKLWDTTANGGAGGYVTGSNVAFGRFCSGDLPEVSAFYNAATGLGTQERIYMNGEEVGADGRAFAHIVTGANAGTSYELARLGNTSFENSVANAFSGDKTVVLSTDDTTPGQVYVYVGTKTNTGTEIDKAGLTNGSLYGIVASGIGNGTNSESALNGATPTSGTFTLADLGNVEQTNGTSLESASDAAGVSEFWRPEDIAWDPTQPNVAYFVTTANFGGPSKLYKLTFNDAANPTAGGSYAVLLDGTEGQKMMDNISVNADGTLTIQEDVGGNDRLGKIWHYDPVTDKLTELAQHDPARFSPGAAGFLTNDEESSGVIDATHLLGDADTQAFILDVQAHYTITGELVEGGQLLAMYVDEVKDGGAGNDRVAGDALANNLNGNAGNDDVWGGSGDDTLLGARGDDTLIGGKGSDVLQGGVDADTFLFDTLTTDATDIITDFRVGQDTLDLGGATVTAAKVSFLSTEASIGGFDLANSSKALDLVLTVSKDGVSQTIKILDAYNFSSNAYWESELGLDLTYPRPLPSGSDLLAIA